MDALISDSTGQVLLAGAAGLLLIQIVYQLALYNRIHLHNKAAREGTTNFSGETPPVSVIIPAREASEQLRRNLASVLEQDYPCFEVIVVNDGHTDESEELLTQMEERYPNLYHSFVPDSSRYVSRKKLALTIGIKASRYDWLVLTDASCRPQSDRWLRLLARNFTPRTEIVLGYSGYERRRGWPCRCMAYDALFTAMRYLGFAQARRPYMGIGRNLAYRKKLFFRQKGFSAHLNLQRGDDDLFVNLAATGQNTRIETCADAAVRMEPPALAKEWREDKIGYASTARLLKGAQRRMAGFETTTRLLFHLCWLTALVLSLARLHWLTAGLSLACFCARLAVQAVVLNTAARELGESYRYYSSLVVFDILQPLQSLRWKLACLLRKKSEFLRR